MRTQTEYEMARSRNDLAMLYEQARSGQTGDLIPAPAHRNPLRAFLVHRQAEYMTKAVGSKFLEYMSKMEAATSGSMIRDLIDDIHLDNDTWQGVKQKPDITCRALRNFVHACEPASAIVGTRVRQSAAFAQLPDIRRGVVREAGYRCVMTLAEQNPTASDKKAIAWLEHFIMECGTCPPPRDERPVGWQPGFPYFVECFMRDAMTLGHACFRKWGTADKSLRHKFPIVSFAAADAGRICPIRRPVKDLRDGVLRTDDWEGERTNTSEAITYVKMSSDEPGGTIVEEYTDKDVVFSVRCPRTDEAGDGFAYGEVERSVNCIDGWIWGRDSNMSRFRTDALPRGILSILGSIDQQQFDIFKLEWAQMLQGVGKRWKIPIIKGNAAAGAGINWIPFDMSSHDMEFHQFLFCVSLWMHSIFGIHPDETGYQALSPFRPPLSEASPETKLKYSQDTSFAPLMRWLQSVINREIVWQVFPDKRYTFKFIGVGDVDEMQDITLRATMLQAGLTTPRMQWNELDQIIPESIAEHPAWDFPMPWADGVQLAMSLQQAEAAEQAQQQQGQMAQEQMMQQAASQQVAAQGAPGQAPPGLPSPNMPPQGALPPGADSAMQQPTAPGLPGSAPAFQKSIPPEQSHALIRHLRRKRIAAEPPTRTPLSAE